MKPHRPTKKMSRIKVTAFKRKMRNIRMKKNPNGFASKEWAKSVTNCTIKVAENIPTSAEWPMKEYPQPKPMMKKHVELVYNKETHMTEKKLVPSTFPTKKYVDIQKKLWKNLPKAAKMELYAQDKLKKWEKANPKPCPSDDVFKDEFIPQWEAEREKALERFRDFVVSMFDKLPLVGRFKQSETKFEETLIAEIKAKDGEGHDINNLDPKKSKTMKKAQKVTDKVHAKRANLVCTNLKDHKRKRGRTILPMAA